MGGQRGGIDGDCRNLPQTPLTAHIKQAKSNYVHYYRDCMTRKETLESAMQCCLHDRQAQHGKPEDSFALIANFWSAYLGYSIKDYEVAVMMGLLKIARMKFNPQNKDNFIDSCGYSACACELATKEL